MTLDWKSVLLICTASTGLFLAVMTYLKAYERRAGFLLLALICAWALLATPLIIGFSGAYQAYPGLTFAPFNTELWIGPLWLVYVKVLTKGALSGRDYLWFVPGTVQTLYYTACFLLLDTVESKFIYSASIHGPIISPLETLAGLSLNIVTVFLSWRLIQVYKAWLPTAHGNTELYDLVWLERSLLAVLIMFGLWAITDIWEALFSSFSYTQTFWLVLAAGMTLAYIASDALSRSHLRFPKIDAHNQASQEKTSDCKPATPIEPLEPIKQRILSEGWHRDPDLNLKKLARNLAVSESSLSRRINMAPGQNFNRLINAIRVSEVCEILRQTRSGQNLLNIALDTGFGSKATFNRAFKAETGKTPREWALETSHDTA